MARRSAAGRASGTGGDVGVEVGVKTPGWTIPSSPARPSTGSATAGGSAKGADSDGIGGISSSELIFSSKRSPWTSLKLVLRGRPDEMLRIGAVGGLDIREKLSLIRERPCALSILIRGLFGVSDRSEGRTIVDPEE